MTEEQKYWLKVYEKHIEAEEGELKKMSELYKEKSHRLADMKLMVQNIKNGLM